MEMIAIDAANVTFMSVVAVACILGPAVAAVIAAVRFRSGPMPIIVGVLVYLLSQTVVRTPLLNLLYAIPGVESFMNAHGVFSDFILSLTTAVIEELARWATFFFVLKKRVNDYSAITYGIGHGGAEVILVAGFAYINNYLTAQAINLSFEAPFDADVMAELAAASVSLSELLPRDMLLTIVIEAAAICMHVMYTFIIARGVRYGTTKICLPLAAGMHFFYLFISSLVGRMPDGILWQAIFSAAVAAACVYYLLEARRRAVMAEYEKRRTS